MGGMKHFIKVVVRRDIHGTVTVTVTHNKLILQTDDIDLADGPNKRKILQAAQWNRKS